MLDALGVVFCRDECKYEGGCSVIWYSMDYVWVECRKVYKRHAMERVFMSSALVVVRSQYGWKREEQRDVGGHME
jgi:hypothetical protein